MTSKNNERRSEGWRQKRYNKSSEIIKSRTRTSVKNTGGSIMSDTLSRHSRKSQERTPAGNTQHDSRTPRRGCGAKAR